MQTVELGTTGQRVSVLCLGTMYFGTTTNEDTSVQLLDHYLEAGGTFLDTANAYARWAPGGNGGESESLLGRWMKQRGNRQDLFIASKVGFAAPPDDVEFGVTAETIERSCEGSLRRMGTDHIDLYYSHNDDRSAPLEERMEAFHRLVKAGKVRHVGASNMTAWRIEQARCVSETNGWPRYCCVQQRFSYLRPRAGVVFDPHAVADNQLFQYCEERGITLLAYSPLLGGAYTRKDKQIPDEYRGKDSETRLAVLREVARETGANENQVVLAWMVQAPPATIPLIAASRKEQQQENLDSLRVKLSADQLERLSHAGNTVQDHPDRQRRKVPGLKEG